jgi:WD40 repeat protein
MEQVSNPNEREAVAGSLKLGVDDSVGQKRGLLQRFADFLFGYDFFISYCWADGRIYATELQRKLNERGFKCFLDSSDYAKGDNWRTAGQRALRKTSRLILIGTPKAVLSEPVANELRIFNKLRRRVFPIDFGGALSGIGTGGGIYRYLDPEMLRVIETSTALADGPSEDVLQQILDSFDLLRQDQKRIRWFGALTAVFATIAAVAVALFFVAKEETRQANSERTLAQTNESKILVSQARQANQRNDFVEAAAMALKALPSSMQTPLKRPYIPEAEVELYRAAFNLPGNTVLRGHEDRVTFATFSPSGVRIVTASHDRTARLWDAISGNLLATLGPTQGRVAHAAFSPDDRLVATASDGDVELWDAATGQRIRGLGLRGSSFVAFSADSQRVAAAGFSGVTIWNAHSGAAFKLDLKERGYAGEQNINSVFAVHALFNPAGDLLVTSDRWDKGIARVWDARTGTPLKSLLGHNAGLYYTTFSADGTRVLTASADNTARIWDARTGMTLLVLRGHNDKVFHADFSPDGKLIVTASKDGTARLWDAASGEVRAVLKHAGEVRHAAFSPRDGLVVTSSRDHTAKVWDFDGNLVATLAGHSADVTHALFSPDGKRILTTGDRTARLWPTYADDKTLAVALRGHREPIERVAFSPDGKFVATASGSRLSEGEKSVDSTVRLWDAHTGAVVKVLQGHTDGIASLSFSRYGHALVSAGFDETARLWDIPSGVDRQQFPGAFRAVLSPDGTLVVTLSDQGTYLWDAHGTSNTRLGEPAKSAIYHAEFSQDGKWLAFTAAGNTVSIWDVQKGREHAVLRGGAEEVGFSRFSPDAHRIVSTGGDRYYTISTSGVGRLWDADTGKLIATLRGHCEPITDVAFSPDGRWIATGAGRESDETKGDRSDSKDNRVLLWEASDGTLVGELSGHTRPVKSVAFSPTSRRLVSGSRDGTARVWDIETRATIAILAHGSWVNDAAFSMDGTAVATVSGYQYDDNQTPDNTGRLWRLFPDTQSLIDHVRAKLNVSGEQRSEMPDAKHRQFISTKR